MSIEYQPIIEIKKSDFDFDLFYKNQPVVIRGLVDDWPLVKASSQALKILYLIFFVTMKEIGF